MHKHTDIPDGNQNLPYPPALRQAIARYRLWSTSYPNDVVEEQAAMAGLDQACYTHSYDLDWVMRRESL